VSDTWIVLLWLPLAFVVGGMLGYRIGVIHGYDRAEAMLEEITSLRPPQAVAPGAPQVRQGRSEAADREQYRRLTAKGEGKA
jgi:hypothetical protein